MKKIALVFFSSTGNTEEMANAIARGVRDGGANVDVYNVSDITADDALGYDVLVLGCPAMGAETLEESEFEPFFSEVENRLSGKTVALFGSYGWGDGEWMRTWQDRVANSGATLLEDGLICNETPDDDALEECHGLGLRIASL